ncbi:hypothetical protein BHE74_00027061 [Ensete ventricosum]|nr:hypothetical protein BHE74_00027061 [Ensete ventricosum]
MLEAYDESSDPTKLVTAFRAQMAPYGMFNALMCRAFPTAYRGPARMWFFWLLIERPPVTVPEMLQCTNQYTTAEVLVVGKRMDHKRPRSEKP